MLTRSSIQLDRPLRPARITVRLFSLEYRGDGTACDSGDLVSEPDVWGGIQNSLFGAGLVKAEEFRIVLGIRQHSDYLVLSK